MAVTTAQIKKALAKCEREEMVALVAEIAKACPQANDFLAVKFAGEDGVAEILKKHKQKIRKVFFPKRGTGKPNLREAKKVISDFAKICPDKALEIDLMLFYVENCVEFTAEFGDMGETFYDTAYNSAVSVYGQIVKAVNFEGEIMHEKFADRLLGVTENICRDWWGASNAIMELHGELVWGKREEAAG